MVFIRVILFLIIYVCVWLYVPVSCRGLQKSEEGTGSSGTGITGGCELPNIDAWNQI